MYPGESFLTKLDTYTVNNREKSILLNNMYAVKFSPISPVINTDPVKFITTDKICLMSQETREIHVRATGPQLLPFRPVSNIFTLAEGSAKLMNRFDNNIFPSITVLTHNNCSTKLRLTQPVTTI